MIKDNTVLFCVIGGNSSAKKVCQTAKLIALDNFAAAAEVGQPAALVGIFQIDDVGQVAGRVSAWLWRLRQEGELAHDVVKVFFIGVDIFTQAQPGAAAFDKQREGRPEMAA